MPTPTTVFTIGHSTHTEEAFLSLLRHHRIQAIADVRSAPYSRMNPHFNRESLKRLLAHARIAYIFLGAELGARPADSACYAEGRVQFDRLARTPLFQSGLARIQTGAQRHRLALMCSEKEPLDCHRTILVSRHLTASGMDVVHIHPDASLEPHPAALDRLAAALPLRSAELHLFRSPADLLADVYALQEKRIAFRPALDSPEEDDEKLYHPLEATA